MSNSTSNVGELRSDSAANSVDGNSRSVDSARRGKQARYWIATVPEESWTPCLPDFGQYVKGQLECGESNGFRHWQFIIYSSKKITLRTLQTITKRGVINIDQHYEPTRSSAAADYVWKDATYVDGTRFEFGKLPFQRNSVHDWDAIKAFAKAGDLEPIPSDIYIRYYRTLLCIASDHEQPAGYARKTTVFVGPTGTGKSHRAWELGGTSAYSKDPRSKFWCGYTGQENVIIDEFRGGIDISHILRWTDKYPCSVEIKGSSRPNRARNIWITSNITPRQWYPDLDETTLDALLRRLEIVEMTERYVE